LFVCEDNRVAAFTPACSVTAGPGAVARAESCGVAAESVDGNDVEAVAEAAARLAARVRRGDGPHLLHARTYRLLGHTSTDHAAWRDPAEVAAAKANDPLARARSRLAAAGVAGTLLDAVLADARAEMEAARADALAAPWPEAAEAWADVQDIGCETMERA
ncbi:MAG: thiamine pyrophosphate-dependent enzyme, partial [Elioraea sp.]|nr:thiamine pyrophosphate-dependent enzyme [Elioraea sp.]